MRKRVVPPQPAPSPASPAFMEIDLVAWAGEPMARAGRRDALLGRVESLRVAADGATLVAKVRDERAAARQVTVCLAGDEVEWVCTCPSATGSPCKHVVAAVEALRFPMGGPIVEAGVAAAGRRSRGGARGATDAPSVDGFIVSGGKERTLTRSERIASASQAEWVLRRAAARRQQQAVKRIDEDGPVVRLEVGAEAVVTLRGVRGIAGQCDCDDYAANELGTCAHVERARNWFIHHRGQVPAKVLSLWVRPRVWEECVPNPLREIRVDWTCNERPAGLDTLFDDDGWIRPEADIEQAIVLVGRVADENGLRAEIDDTVHGRLQSERHKVDRRRLLEGIQDNDEAWQSITRRVPFTLHPYQCVGARFLATRGRAFLADDMGLGKTIQAIVAALLLREAKEARRILIVCPASLKHQWRQEIEASCEISVRVLEGTRATRHEAYATWQEGFMVVNYELVLRDLEQIKRTGIDLVILDEAQRIKNWDTKTARAVKQIPSRHAFILTGTPLENRLMELHSLVEFLHPRALGPRWRLLPFHAVTELQGRVLAYEGLDVLRARLSEFFVRRDRRQVMDQLPPRTDNTFWINMTSLQRRAYRRHAGTVARLVGNNRALQPGEVRLMLQALTRMRILCNAHAQYEWESFADRVEQVEAPTPLEIKRLGSPKLEEFAAVLEELLDETDEKVVVFSQWDRMLRLAEFVVRDGLRSRGVTSKRFHGGLTSRARSTMLDAFREEPEFRVLFSTDAGGLGLNLQHAASIVIHLEVPWNPAVIEQRIGRVHRMGQRRSVQVLHFVSRGAIEERVRRLVESKRALFDGLLVNDADYVKFDDAGRTAWLQRIGNLLET
ncbi:MAG: DEAD/DEAH box helicase [Acidobacteriota bacterium]|nr:DEAD/DEAH box helicase [Acidobacteriota bacterium]